MEKAWHDGLIASKSFLSEFGNALTLGKSWKTIAIAVGGVVLVFCLSFSVFTQELHFQESTLKIDFKIKTVQALVYLVGAIFLLGGAGWALSKMRRAELVVSDALIRHDKKLVITIRCKGSGVLNPKVRATKITNKTGDFNLRLGYYMPWANFKDEISGCVKAGLEEEIVELFKFTYEEGLMLGRIKEKNPFNIRHMLNGSDNYLIHLEIDDNVSNIPILKSYEFIYDADGNHVTRVLRLPSE